MSSGSKNELIQFNFKLFVLLSILASMVAMVIPYGITYNWVEHSALYSGIDKKVAAFYYGWYSNTTNYTQSKGEQTGKFQNVEIVDDTLWRHWNFESRGWYPPANACSTNTPTQGWYDSADPTLIETQLKQAEWAGIDSFIVSYWGVGFEWNNFKTMVDVSRAINSNVSLSLYFEIFMGGLPDLPANEAIPLLTTHLESIYDFMTAPENKDYMWYENDMPVIFTYVSRAISADVWTGAINNLTAKGKSFLLIADRPGSSVEYNQNFNGIHQYDVYYPTYHGEYLETFLEHKNVARNYKYIFAAGVGPGYDDRVVRDGNPPLDRFDGNTYKESWKKAVSLNPDWITITSWNEWHEGSEIELSLENGDLALNQTKLFAEEFKSGNYSELKSGIIIYPAALNLIITSLLLIGLSISLSLIHKRLHIRKQDFTNSAEVNNANVKNKDSINLEEKEKITTNSKIKLSVWSKLGIFIFKFFRFLLVLIAWLALIAFIYLEIMLARPFYISKTVYIFLLPIIYVVGGIFAEFNIN